MNTKISSFKNLCNLAVYLEKIVLIRCGNSYEQKIFE